MDQSGNLISKPTNALFWDVDPDMTNVHKQAAYIFERVLTGGTSEDSGLMKAFYGKSKIKHKAINLRYLDVRELQFCSVYFDIPVSECRCYTSNT